MQLREEIIAEIQAFKFVMDLDGLKGQEFIESLMPESFPFVQPSRASVFFEGIFS